MNLLISILQLTLLFPTVRNTAPDTKLYELRIYYCNPGKLDALVQRFANHTTKLFEKHGMENIGYWLPVDNKENALYYVLAFPSKEARDASWKSFGSDPVWQEVARKSEENGKILTSITSIFMNAADFSPAITSSKAGKDRLFELRTYYCQPGKLPDLLTRFRDHTLKLFEKQGMQNIAYWTTIEPDGKQAKLVYILAHPNQEAATKAWDGFRADPVWVKAKTESEKNGPIVEKVESVMMNPLPFSTIR